MFLRSGGAADAIVRSMAWRADKALDGSEREREDGAKGR